MSRVYRTPRCPKCRSKQLELIEVCEEHGRIWQDENGKLRSLGDEPRDLVFEAGAVTGVRARCLQCNHFWRTALPQITNHPDYDTESEDSTSRP